MHTRTIDCAGISSEAEFWDLYLRVVAPVEDGFGRNLDAFWDALAGGPGWPGDCALSFVNTEGLCGLRGGHFLKSLREIAADSRHTRVSVS